MIFDNTIIHDEVLFWLLWRLNALQYIFIWPHHIKRQQLLVGGRNTATLLCCISTISRIFFFSLNVRLWTNQLFISHQSIWLYHNSTIICLIFDGTIYKKTLYILRISCFQYRSICTPLLCSIVYTYEIIVQKPETANCTQDRYYAFHFWLARAINLST